MKTVACIGSNYDFRKLFGIDYRSYNKEMDTEYLCVGCEEDYFGKRFNSVLNIYFGDSRRYENIYKECIARCNNETVDD